MNVDKYRNVFIVGDIHGEITKLEEALKRVSFDKQHDLLVSVGDLVDRGEDSYKTLMSLVYEPWFTMVLGNHEELMINSILDNNIQYQDCWMVNGGTWFAFLSEDEQREVKDVCQHLRDTFPYTLCLERNGKKILISHGDYPLDFYSKGVNLSPDRIIWNRDRINTYKSYGREQRIQDVDLAVFGHTPLREPTRSGNCCWIDTGACFKKENVLTLLNIDYCI
ncbi:calcineurin-like phosphoesterase [Vibrio phage 1.101.O._10N.261.45.C6]|nr:calcineurin-like phosphoesterase [Vibrio phage 1.101.O._10N.261.45.C6]